MDDKANVEESMLAEARTEVSYADHKASMVLAALGIGFGAVVGGLLAGSWTPSAQGDGEFAWWLGACLALLSVAFAAGAVWPRYSGRKNSGDLFYWGQVSAVTSFEELSKMLDAEPLPPGARTRHQLWELSKIVAMKYRLIRAAFVSAGLALLAFAVSALLAL